MSSKRTLSSAAVKTSEVNFVEVRNEENEFLGSVQDIVLDKQNGHARYIVIATHDLVGREEKLFAIPWSTISYDANKQCFIFPMQKEVFDSNPSFDESMWPDFPDGTLTEKIHQYYDDKACWI